MSQHLRLTREQYAAIEARRKPANKFGARKKQIDGITFDSTHEAEVYMGLKLRVKAGEIFNLRTHVPLQIDINREHVFSYECDFVFEHCPHIFRGIHDEARQTVYQDAKGYKKGAAYQLFRLKKAVIKAALGIEIEEV